ncbi:MAG: hypothetical protein AAB391_01430 [Patescibacteria group bacterium]
MTTINKTADLVAAALNKAVRTSQCGDNAELTIDQIHFFKLLRNHKSMPYVHKATVSRVLSKSPYKKKITPLGMTKVFSGKTINKLNNRWEYRD